MNCKQILNKCLDCKGNISPKKSKHLSIIEQKYLLENFPFLDNINIILQHIKYNINEQGYCKECGKPTKWIKNHYQEYCCILCMQQSNTAKENRKKTNIIKYGVSTNLQLKSIREKAKENSHTIEAISKQHNTKKKKYGWATPFQNPKSMNLAISNSHNKIGNARRIDTNINKYGCENPMQNINIKEKIKQTCIKRYNVINPWQLEKVKINSQTKEAKQKALETKRKNHTFNSSKPEEELYLYIKEKFPDVIRQYRDEKRYPWCCDFYIPMLDYFIELNGNWTHGKHAFSSTSKEDLYIIEEWKKRSVEHPYYGNAIKTWTIYDMKKRNKAKKENLNFKEVWSLEEGKEFINNLT